MDAFNFAFTLFGLLLGFTLVEMLSGLAKALRARRRIRIGWLTPLLAVFVMMDLLSFWQGAWAARTLIPVSYAALLAGLAITGTYYLAASWVFPEVLTDGLDLDDHYLAHRRVVLIGVWACNVVPFTLLIWRMREPPSPLSLAMIGVYWLLVGCAVASRSRIVNGVALAGLIGVYCFTAVG